MPIGPEGVVVEGSASDDETGGAVGGAEKETEGRGGAGVVLTRNAVLGRLAL